MCRNGFGGGRQNNFFGKSQNNVVGKKRWKEHYFLGVHLVVEMKNGKHLLGGGIDKFKGGQQLLLNFIQLSFDSFNIFVRQRRVCKKKVF